MQVISFISASGGVGKTLFSILTAGALALSKRVLLVDFDPSAASTLYLLQDYVEDCNLKTLIKDIVDVYRGASDRRRVFVEDCLRTHKVAGAPSKSFQILPGGNLEDVKSDVFSVAKWHSLLSEALEPVVGQFDYVIVDAPNWVYPLFPMTIQMSSYYVVLTRPWPSEVKRTMKFLERVTRMMKNAFRIDQPELYAVVVLNQFRSNMKGDEVRQTAEKAIKSLRAEFPQLRIVTSEIEDQYYGENKSQFWGFKYVDRLSVDQYLTSGHPLFAGGEKDKKAKIQFERYIQYLESFLKETSPYVIE